MKNCKLKLIAAAVMMSLSSAGAQAADTSSAIRGKITGPEGNSAAQVRITVKHQPTGTVKAYVTNEAGVFVAKGLPVGGPYTVTVDSDEFQDTEMKGIYLTLGDTYRANAQLKPIAMETISVSATRLVETNGASSVWGEDFINRMPSINRDLKDLARINPMASIRGNGELTIAGGNPRTNSITVDGIGQNDDFGLNYGGYPTAQPPISMDAIEQVSVDVAPFSTRKGGFAGGNINAVTKSGTNEFKGTMFYEFTNPDMAGDIVRTDRADDVDENGFRQFETSTVESISNTTNFGVSVGGPIIEDEVFFFVNYDEWRSELEMDYGFNGSGAAHEFDASEEDYNEFLRILKDTYGIEDSIGGNPEDVDKKWLVKFNWNINDNHRWELTYQGQDNRDEREFATGGSTIRMNSRRYVYKTELSNYATKLFSDWTDEFTTEIGITYKDVENSSLTRSNFGAVMVEKFFRGPAFEFGTDVFRHANAAENQNLTIHFDANYLLGEHDIKFGAQFERLRLYNLFAQNSLGSWEFDDFEGFENREVGNFRGNYDFSYDNAYTNNAMDTAYDATRYTFSLYAEDTFYLTDEVEITAGFRYERLSSDDKPTLNANFMETYGFSNQNNLDGLSVFMPRVSFKWFYTDDLTIRGGFGRFSGGNPNVWYTGPFTMDGITLVAAPESVINDYFANTDEPADFTQVPQAIQDSMQAGAGSTNYIDPDFKMPSDWRIQLAADLIFDIPYLGDGFAWTNELLYVRTYDEAVWHNTALVPLDENGSLNYAADGVRLIQTSIYEGDAAENFDIMMTNAEESGHKRVFTTSLSKAWDNGFNMSLSYANQDIEENQAGSSSRNQSNYKHLAGVNRNQDLVARGHYETEHSFKLTLGYNTELFEGYETRINLFWERHSGRPYSYTMSFFRDGDLGDTEEFYSNGAYLAYIPSGPNDTNVDWDNSVSWDELSRVIESAGLSACGCIVDRNTHTMPWVTKMDLSIQQEVPGFVEGHKGTVYFTIANLANLLNDDWGVERRLGFSTQNLYDFGGLDDQGRYQIDRLFRGYDTRNWSQEDLSSSAWQVRFGLRYTF